MLLLQKQAFTPILVIVMNNEIENTETLVFKKKMQALQAVPDLMRIDPTGMVRLAVSDFEGFKGQFEAVPYFTIHMCIKHIARIRRVGVRQQLEGVMRPGTVGIAMPNSQAEGYWTKMKMLAIGVDLNRLLFQTQDDKIDINRLHASASTLHNDPLLTSVMTSLWRDAEAHDLSTPFFEQGLMLILRRLSDYKPKGISYRAIRPLKGQRLQNVLSLMEARIGENINLTELAKLSGQDKSSFSRSFQDAIGHTPYEYFILRRIEHAKKLLHTTMSITNIAFSVGYTNPSKFSVTFKKVVGNTPSQWRKSCSILKNKLN